MLAKAVEQGTPTQILGQEVLKFTRDLESLHAMMPLYMLVTEAARLGSLQEYHSFLASVAVEKSEGTDTTSFTIKVEDILQANRRKRRYENAEIVATLIPRHFVTSLVSQYDSFLSRVVRFIFALKPHILDASERNLSYTDLQAFPSIDAVREHIIEKEIESVLRKSHSDQFAWLKAKLRTPFNKGLKSWPCFIELTERRNLFIHCDGIINSQYLKICSEHGCDIGGLKPGEKLTVNRDYFENAYKCVYEIGVKLAHVIWRRLSPDQIDDSDSNITDITYQLIENGEYKLAIRLLQYFTQDHIKHASDQNKRIMTINLAQALKWSKDEDACRKVLASMDWSASNDQFKLGVAVLEDNYVKAFGLMKGLKDNSEFHKTFYKDWPLFKELIKQDGFSKTYEECYDEQFKIEEKTLKMAEGVEQGIPADLLDAAKDAPSNKPLN